MGNSVSFPTLVPATAVAKREGYKLDRYLDIEIAVLKFAHYEYFTKLALFLRCNRTLNIDNCFKLR